MEERRRKAKKSGGTGAYRDGHVSGTCDGRPSSPLLGQSAGRFHGKAKTTLPGDTPPPLEPSSDGSIATCYPCSHPLELGLECIPYVACKRFEEKSSGKARGDFKPRSFERKLYRFREMLLKPSSLPCRTQKLQLSA